MLLFCQRTDHYVVIFLFQILTVICAGKWNATGESVTRVPTLRQKSFRSGNPPLTPGKVTESKKKNEKRLVILMSYAV
jgi:hypothetical protein